MSGQRGLWDNGVRGSESRTPAEAIRASIAREMRYLLTISSNASNAYSIRPAGIAHSIGVVLTEDWNMARGKGQGNRVAKESTLPRFIDVKLSTEQREEFVGWYSETADQVRVLQDFADSGYRVGVTWSGEHQTYTVSATCRNEEDANNGLCMTAFSGSLPKAIALLWFKHNHVADCDWQSYAGGPTESFG